MPEPSVWEKNRAVLARRFPGVLKALSAAPSIDAAPSHGFPDRTLIVSGVHLTSTYHRLAEAELQATAVPPGAARAAVYGVALGDLQRVLLGRPGLNALDVVVLSPAVSAASFRHFDHTDWLADPRVQLALAERSSVPRAPYAVAPACMRFAEGRAIPLRDRLALELTRPHQSKHVERMDALTRERLERSKPRLAADGDVAVLFGQAAGAQAIVVGGGPTLDERLDWLREHQQGRLVVAVSTALAPLLAAGIVPDVVIAIDPEPTIADHLAGDLDRLGATPLVYLPIVVDAALDRWPGPRLAAYLDRPQYRALAAEVPRGTLFCSGTVLHSAIDLAVKMGAAEVVLLGADFGYVAGRSHAARASQAHAVDVVARGCYFVDDGLGGRVASELNLIGFLRDLELYVRFHPAIRFWNGSRRGARIEGVAYLEAA